MSDLENNHQQLQQKSASSKTKYVVIGLIVVVAVAVAVVLGVVLTRNNKNGQNMTDAPVTNAFSHTVVFTLETDQDSFNDQKQSAFIGDLANAAVADESLFTITKTGPSATTGSIDVYVKVSGSSQAEVNSMISKMSSFPNAAFYASVQEFETQTGGSSSTPVPTQSGTTSQTVAPTTATTKAPFKVMIDSGSNTAEFTDVNGTWSLDNYFNSGVSKTYIGATGNELYDSERFFMNKGPGEGYNVPVPHNGTYHVELLFVEVYFETVGARLFNCIVEGINLNGKTIDIYAQAGGKGVPLWISGDVQVTDGTLDIILTKTKQNPKISGFKITYVQ